MDDATKSANLSVEAFVQRMQEKTAALLRGVGEAVNAAPDGAWINASEMQVRDLFAEMRRDAYETALQMRLEATQAAFSPGGQADGPAPVQQSNRKPQHPDNQRPGEPLA